MDILVKSEPQVIISTKRQVDQLFNQMAWGSFTKIYKQVARVRRR